MDSGNKMKKTILLLIGPSGCGKSTFERQLLEFDDVYRVVSTATREIREGEIDGISYHFVTKWDFLEMEKRGEFIQTTNFIDEYYGTTKAEYTTNHPIIVLSIVPNSAATFIPVLSENFPLYDIRIVYFDISRNRLRQNMLNRGDKDTLVEFRLTHDDIITQFDASGLEPDIILTDVQLTNTIARDTRNALKI